jgi:HlyD family secretion protein
MDTIVNSIKKQEVRSPADGTIIERLVDENIPAVPQMAAFIIEDTDRLEIEANVLSDDINKVQIGDEVEISGKPLDDEILMGKVTKIAPAAKAEMSTLGVSQNRVPVTIEINGDTSLLKPGFSVDAKIITANRKNILMVPDSSVFDYEGKSTIFVVENGKTRLRIVEKGIESDDYIEIISGLKEGEMILSKPDNSIKEGMRIK